MVGLLTYQVTGDTVDIVTTSAFTGGGVGSALLGALVEEFRGAAARLRVTTTNDNTRSLRVGAVVGSRKIKEIPEFGHDDIPIRDELELEMEISQ